MSLFFCKSCCITLTNQYLSFKDFRTTIMRQTPSYNEIRSCNWSVDLCSCSCNLHCCWNTGCQDISSSWECTRTNCIDSSISGSVVPSLYNSGWFGGRQAQSRRCQSLNCCVSACKAIIYLNLVTWYSCSVGLGNRINIYLDCAGATGHSTSWHIRWCSWYSCI